MSQYTTGTVTVTNGSPTVTGSGTSWSGNVTAGSVFTVTGSGVPYIVGSVDSNTQITLTGNYAGTTLSGQSYSLTTSFTPNRKLPYMEQGDVDPATVHKRAMVALDAILGAVFSANRVLFTDGSGNMTHGSGLTYDGTTFAAKALSVTASLATVTGDLTVTGQANVTASLKLGTAWFVIATRTTGVANSATTIATLPSSSYTGKMTVIGESGSAGFVDEVAVIASTLTVINSTTIYGSPGARTYTQTSTAMKVSVASGTWTINTKLDVAA